MISADLARPQPGALPPRAQAVLVALRRGSLTALEIRNRISDETADQTRSLLIAMREEAVIMDDSGRWYLTTDGLGWLESNGMTACDSAKSWYRGGPL